MITFKNTQSVRTLQFLHSIDPAIELQLLSFQDNLNAYAETFQEEVQKQNLNKMLSREAMSAKVSNQITDGSLCRHCFSS